MRDFGDFFGSLADSAAKKADLPWEAVTKPTPAPVKVDLSQLTYHQQMRHGRSVPFAGAQPAVVLMHITESVDDHIFRKPRSVKKPELSEYYVLDGRYKYGANKLFAVAVTHAADLIAAHPAYRAKVVYLPAIDDKGEAIQQDLPHAKQLFIRHDQLVSISQAYITPTIAQLAKTLMGVRTLESAATVTAPPPGPAPDFLGAAASISERFRGTQTDNFGRLLKLPDAFRPS